MKTQIRKPAHGRTTYSEEYKREALEAINERGQTLGFGVREKTRTQRLSGERDQAVICKRVIVTW